MKELLSIQLENLAYFKKAKLEFTKGLTFIQGSNKNARFPKASNGSGKSSLFIPLHSAFAYVAPLSKTKSGAKDTFGKSSRVSVEYKQGDKKWSIQRHGNKFKVSVNGKDLGLRTTALALSKIEKLRGLTETQFYSTVYLDSSRPHTFQAGTSADRFNFITDLFDLHAADDIRRKIKERLSTVQSEVEEMDRLKLEASSLNAVAVKPLVVKYKKLESSQKSIQVGIQGLVRLLHSVEFREKVHELEKRLAKLKSGKSVKELRVYLDEAKKAEESENRVQEFKEKKVALLSELRTLKSKLPDVNESQLRDLLSKFAALADIEPPVKPRDSRPDVEAKNIDKLEKKLAREKVAVEEASESLSALESHTDEDDAATCPVCAQDLPKHHFATLRTLLKKKKKEGLLQIERLEGKIEEQRLLAEWADYDKQIKAFEKAREGYSEEVESCGKKFLKRAEAYRQLISSKPELIVSKFSVSKVEAKLIEAEKRERLENEVKALKAGIDTDTDFDPQKDGVEHAKRRLETLKARLEKVNAILPKLHSRISEARKTNTRLKEISDRLEVLKENTGDAEVLQHMVAAYSKTGVKSLLIQRIAKSIEKNLNALAPSILREPMRFALVIEGQNFHVQATRLNLSKARVSDVRTLSGAERRMFILLFLLATLPLMPNSKRFDTILLDEPFANLDVVNAEMLRDNLLPRLLTVVPKVVAIVTQKEHTVAQGARLVTVVKTDDRSVLKEGPP